MCLPFKFGGCKKYRPQDEEHTSYSNRANSYFTDQVLASLCLGQEVKMGHWISDTSHGQELIDAIHHLQQRPACAMITDFTDDGSMTAGGHPTEICPGFVYGDHRQAPHLVSRSAIPERERLCQFCLSSRKSLHNNNRSNHHRIRQENFQNNSCCTCQSNLPVGFSTITFEYTNGSSSVSKDAINGSWKRDRHAVHDDHPAPVALTVGLATCHAFTIRRQASCGKCNQATGGPIEMHPVTALRALRCDLTEGWSKDIIEKYGSGIDNESLDRVERGLQMNKLVIAIEKEKIERQNLSRHFSHFDTDNRLSALNAIIPKK
jgi:hypothetical protein